MTRDLDALFRPQSVAVIGGSRDPQSMSGTPVRNLLESFRGPVYVVNPRAVADGLRNSFATIGEIPGPVDLALVAVPAQHVLAVVRECIAKPVRAMVMITAGFAELGAAGLEASHELLDLVRSANIPLVGPNCLGVVSNDPTWPLNASFGPRLPAVGPVSLLTQSGGLGFVLVEYLRLRNLGIAELVSLGNKLDLDESDVLEHWERASDGRVVALYLESFQSPRRLLEVGRRISHTRPVVLLKSGRTAAGGRAAGSHSAALATPDRLADGLARQAGFVRVDTAEELCEAMTLLARQPAPRGRRVAIVTNAGGPGVMLADALALRQWTMPELSPELQSRLRELAGPLATVCNPVDLVGTVDPDLYGQCVGLLLESDEIDAVAPVYVPRLPATSLAVARAIGAQHAAQSALAATTKTVVAVLMESEAEVARLQAECEPVACFQFPDSLARALTCAADYARRRPASHVDATRDQASSDDRALAGRAAVLELFESHHEAGWLDPATTQRVLEQIGLPIPIWEVAVTAEEAVVAAERIGFPLVLKAIAPGLLHKAARGGVVLDVRNESELRSVWRDLSARLAALTGVFMQAYRPGRDEVFVGVKWEPGFGHVVGLGTGGSRVEQNSVVEFRLLPLVRREIDDLIRDSAVAGVCLRPDETLMPAGAALAGLVGQISSLVEIVPAICELDLNPIALEAPDAPLRILDARIYVECR